MRTRRIHAYGVARKCLCLLAILVAVPVDCCASATGAKPPTIPASFDKSTVEKLVSGIVTPPNAAVLRVGYFMNRKVHPYPVSDGLKLLVSASETEPLYSARWAALETMIGFGSFRMREPDINQGFKAYSALFTHAQECTAHGGNSWVQRGITEYTASLRWRMLSHVFKSDVRTADTLMLAWAAFTHVDPPVSRTIDSIDWKAAVTAALAWNKMADVVKKALAGDMNDKPYRVLAAAAAVLETSDLKTALAAIKAAHPKLPNDPLIRERYFNQWVSVADGLSNPSEAVDALHSKIATMDVGRPILLQRFSKKLTTDDVSKIIGDISVNSTPEQEITGIGEWLLLGQEEPSRQATGRTLLQLYLVRKTARSNVEELRARLALGGYFIKTKRNLEARAVVAGAPAIAQDTNQSAHHLRSLLNALLNDATSPL